MSTPDHSDIYRALGRVEGDVSSMQDDIREIKEAVKELVASIRAMEDREAERKGAWKALAVLGAVAGFLGGLFANIGSLFMGVVK